MTRRLTLALTGLNAVLGFSPLAHAMRHDGKAHADLHARQEETSITELLGSGAIDVSPVSSSIPEITLTIVPLPVNTSLIPTIGQSSVPDYSVPSFPTTTVQEPVATVCPGQPADSGIFSILPFPSISTINATALLPNGSSTVFSSGVTSTSSPPSSISFPPADPNDARVVLDDNGCQTLFAPQLKAVCSTVVSPLGIPEVTVTDCDQYITFSSDTKVCPTIFPPTPTPAPMPTVVDPVPLGNDATNLSPDPISADPPAAPAPPPQKRDNDDASASALPPNAITAPLADPDATALLPLPTASPSPGAGTYYACAWYDAARGGVPPRVRAIECRNDDTVGGGAGCTTFEERWSETSFARTVTETRVISYSGPVVVTDGTRTYTTTISVSTTTTAVMVTFSPIVIKRRLLEGVAADAGATDTAVAAAGMGEPSTVRATSTLTETEYLGTATSEVAEGQQGGVRTIELVPGPEGV